MGKSSEKALHVWTYAMVRDNVVIKRRDSDVIEWRDSDVIRWIMILLLRSPQFVFYGLRIF